MPLVVVLMLVTLCTPAFSADPFIGEWKMDLAKSQYTGKSTPESGVVRFEAEPDGLRHTLEWVNADGGGARNTFRAKFDGKEYPALGSGQTVSRKRLNANAFEATFKKNGKVTNRDRWAVSADGKTLTLTSEGVDSSTGKPFKIAAVFDRR
jgi:hypothetical protein